MLLSGLLRTYNEEANIVCALNDLLSFCDQVIISDGGSTDRTRELATEFVPRVVWLDFPGGSISEAVHFNHAGRQLNFGLHYCEGDWVIVNDVDIVHCDWIKAHLRQILRTTDCDAFAMYGVHIVQDHNHYASEFSTGPGMIQLFRNKPGIAFPDEPEHACHMNHIHWEKVGILRGGVFHYGYLNREQELAKIQLRAQALPDDPTYQMLVKDLPEHKPAPIPWERCNANCTTCWMEEAVRPFVLDKLMMSYLQAAKMMAKTTEDLKKAREAEEVDTEIVAFLEDCLEKAQQGHYITGLYLDAMMEHLGNA